MNKIRATLVLTFTLSLGIFSTSCFAQGQSNPAGTVGYSKLTPVTPEPCGVPGWDDQYSGWYFIDSQGTTHTFAGTSTSIGGKFCVHFPLPAETTGFTATSSDGLYSITTNGSTGVVIQSLIQGYVDPKYVILGVVYAPPGANSYVEYTTTESLSKTSSVQNTFGSSVTKSVSVSRGVSIPKVASGKITVTSGSTYTESATSSSSVTLTQATSSSNTYFGTPYVPTAGSGSQNPVNHNYDQIVLWLNAAEVFSVSPTAQTVAWNGYAFDTNDQPAMDIISVPVGYLNGEIGTMPSSLALSLSRAWAQNQLRGSGGPGLTQADYDEILLADPFANQPSPANANTYSLGLPLPSTSADGRFTISSPTGGSAIDFPFIQSLPGSNANEETYVNTYSQMSTLGESTTTGNTTTYGIDVSFSGSGFLSAFSSDVSTQYQLSTSDVVSSSMTNLTSAVDTLFIEGPPCNSNSSPCVPPYAGPAEFDVYQDNIYGTFMIYPVN